MKEMTLEEKLKQPIPVMNNPEYQKLYQVMLKNHMLKTQDQVQEELKNHKQIFYKCLWFLTMFVGLTQ